MYYTIAEIEQIKMAGFVYTLPETILQVLQVLENDLQITNVDSAEPHKKTEDAKPRRPNDHRNYRNQKTKEVTSDDWELIRSFKSTKIEKKEGVEKNINHIRVLLNKISNKNYDTQKIVLLDSIAECIQESGSPEDIEKINQAIFDIVSTNKFFSEIYAQLYKELMERFPVFGDILQKYIQVYKRSIDEIHFVDPNKDYDGFCSYTKINDHRRAMTLFMVNMFKNGMLQQETVTDMLQHFLNRTLEYMDSENRSNELEEITENVFLIISNIQTQMGGNETWNTVLLPIIIRISQMKFKDHVSLTNRVIFKYMDIIDSIDP